MNGVFIWLASYWLQGIWDLKLTGGCLLTNGTCCRSDVRDDGMVTVPLRIALFAGHKVVIHTKYAGSLLSGLARTAAFDDVNPVTQTIESQVIQLHGSIPHAQHVVCKYNL